MNQPARVMGENPRNPKEIRQPLQCWSYGGPHTYRNYPHEEGYVRPTYNVQEVETIGQVARKVHRIYAALEDWQEDNQSTMVEVAVRLLSTLFLF